MGSGGYDSTTFRPGPSASTGSGVGGAAPGAGDLATSCPILAFRTPLNSVDPKVLPKLSVGDELWVDERGGVVLAVTDDGEIAGSITSKELSHLLDCMAAGFGYVAIVESINGGTCIVAIKHKKK